jgi:TonB family protein
MRRRYAAWFLRGQRGRPLSAPALLGATLGCAIVLGLLATAGGTPLHDARTHTGYAVSLAPPGPSRMAPPAVAGKSGPAAGPGVPAARPVGRPDTPPGPAMSRPLELAAALPPVRPDPGPLARAGSFPPRAALAELPDPVAAPGQPAAADGVSGPESYWADVRRAIAGHLRYPEAARRGGVEGCITFRLCLDADGALLEAQALTVNADPSLRAAALRAIRRAAPFASPGTNATSALTADLPIRFELGT